MSSGDIHDETAELAARWRARAAMLEQAALSYRKMGDDEYARDLEQAAADNRAAASRLEIGLVP